MEDVSGVSNTKASKAKKVHLIHSKRRLLTLQRREELSHNIRYISKVPVSLVMDTEFLTLHPGDPLSKLVQELRGEESSAVVVDDEGKLLGFVTMKDILHFFEPPKRYSVVGINLLKKYSVNRASRVGDIMVKKPITINVDENLGRAIQIMLETGKHHLPVVDDENRVHGVLEVKDIIRLIRIVSY
ncbi:CBS domain-containing protein [Thermococcus peptonophilus]|uniref:CBS domain-containing protein n=1 Tax=Thermococcus peptonophilus TaxID=53952 RepID=A0A142CW50_9EURY|nr:CBS domain-containing protein [Thermococcus peptonophilus]AMQ19002.1 CBS domain-containing protein [Thermococcus peptonophilus]